MAGTLPPVVAVLQANIDDFSAKIDEARQKLADLDGDDAAIEVGANTDDADSKLDDTKGKLDDLDGRTAEADVHADTDDADAKLEETKAQVDELDGKTAVVTVEEERTGEGFDENGWRNVPESEEDEGGALGLADRGEGAGAGGGGTGGEDLGGAAGARGFSMQGFQSSASKLMPLDSAIAGVSAKMMTLGPVAAAAATAIGGAFMALPGILSGVAAGFGSLFVGLHNISAAISAYTNASQQANLTGIQMAQQQISNAQTMTNAAEQVASAQMALSQAQVQAYDQILQAQQQVTLSEQQLQDAEEAELMAQRQLVEARMQAADQLQNYKNQLADMAIQQEQAATNVQAAQLAYAETIGNPAATEIQKAQAREAYQMAVQQVTDLKTQSQQLAQEYQLAASKGVQGSDQVVQAKQGVIDANNRLVDSQTNLSNSVMYNQQAQVNAADTVIEAQRQLTMAMQNQQYSAEQVALSMQMPIGAMSQLAQAMNKLGPSAQAFVTWWHDNMTPLLQSLTIMDQNVLLPGLQKALQALVPYMQALGPILVEGAAGFDKFAQSVAQFLSSPQGLKELNATVQSGLGFMAQLGHAVLLVMEAFGRIGASSGSAVHALGQMIVSLAQSFAKWAASGGPAKIAHDFVALLDAVGKLIGGLGPLKGVLLGIPFGPVGMAIGAMLPLFVRMLPLVEQMAVRFEKAVKPELTLFLRHLGQAFVDLFTKSGPLLINLARLALRLLDAIPPRVLADLIKLSILAFAASKVMGTLHAGITILSSAFGPLISGIKLAGMAIMDTDPLILLIVAAAALLAIGIYELLKHWNVVWGAIRSVAETVWNFLNTQVFQPIANFFTGIVIGALNTFQNVWNSVWNGIQSVMSAVWSVIQPVFNGIKTGVQDVSNAINTVSNVGGGVGRALSSIIPHLAAGGFVTQPTLAVVGEAGPEAVLPLSDPQRARMMLASLTGTSGAAGMPLAVGAAGGPGAGSASQQVNVYAQTNASPELIATEVAWAMKTGGASAAGPAS